MGTSTNLPNVDQFIYQPTAGAATTQAITAGKKCAVDMGTGLVTVTPGGTGQTGTPALGLVNDSIGVKYGSDGTGTPCGRVDDLETLALTLQNGAGSTLQALTANYAELDIEGKQSVTVVAKAYLGGALQETDTLSPAAFGGADNGPDSGPGDNARLVIGSFSDPSAVRFDSVVLSAQNGVGAFSLEGGSDGTPAGPYGTSLGTNDSVFRMVSDASLSCTSLDGVANFYQESGTAGTASITLTAPGDCTTSIPVSVDPSVQGLVTVTKPDVNNSTYLLTIDWTVPSNTDYPLATQIDTGSGFHPMLACLPGPSIPSSQLWCVSDSHLSVTATDKHLIETYIGTKDVTFKRNP